VDKNSIGGGAYVIGDSGEREQHASGAVRDVRRGKGRFDLITPIAIAEVADVYEGGAEKYAARNWEKGMPLSRFIDSAKRHINDLEMIALYRREGIPLDQLPANVNPNENHAAQAAWNLFAFIHHRKIHPELDDLTVKLVEKRAEVVPISADVSETVKESILNKFLRR